MSDFESAARRPPRTGFLYEFWAFLRHTRKWWLLPIVAVLVILGLMTFLSGTAAAPFIYSLF